MERELRVKGFCPLTLKEETVYFILFPDRTYRFNGCDNLSACQECKECRSRRAAQLSELYPEYQIHVQS